MKTVTSICRLSIAICSLLVLGMAILPERAEAQVRRVDCNAGRKIAPALRFPAGRHLTIEVSGACTENVTIARDDVTLRGLPGATLTALNSGASTILIDGARRVRIEGLTVIGGSGGITGTNGAVFNIANVVVQGSTRWGVDSAYGSTATIDGSTIQNITGDGVISVNNASLVVTNSILRNNTGTGATGSRSAHLRLGQDPSGTTVVRPVTIEDNGSCGVLVADNSAGIVVGGSITGNTRPGVCVVRGSHAQIGAGTGGLVASINVQDNSDGVYVEGATATILGLTISGNRSRGITVTNGGTARIGIKDDSSGYVGNSITGNAFDGILVSTGSSAFIGGNTISANGTNTTPPVFRFGIQVIRATATLIGDNLVENHPSSGIFVSGGSVRLGDSGFGLLTANTIRGNGATGEPGTTGGIYAFQGGILDVFGATITGNHGGGAFAFEEGVIDLRENNTISGSLARSGQSVDSFDGGSGVVAFFGSTIRLRAGTTVTGNAGNGVMIGSGSIVDFRSPPAGTAPASVTGNTNFGLRCFFETNYSGNVTGVTGNADGNDDGAGANPALGNIGGNQSCTRF